MLVADTDIDTKILNYVINPVNIAIACSRCATRDCETLNLNTRNNSIAALKMPGNMQDRVPNEEENLLPNL